VFWFYGGCFDAFVLELAWSLGFMIMLWLLGLVVGCVWFVVFLIVVLWIVICFGFS